MARFISARVLTAGDLSPILIYPNWTQVLAEEDVLLIKQRIRENEVSEKVHLLSSFHLYCSALRGIDFAVLCSYFKVNAMEAMVCCEAMIRRREVTLYSAARLFELLTDESDALTARRMVNCRIEREVLLAREMAFLCYRPMRHRVTPMQAYVLCEVYGKEFEKVAKVLERELLIGN